MKSLAALIVAAALTSAPFAAVAQTTATDRSFFIDMTQIVIDGVVQKPTFLVLEGRDRVKWARLFHLKKSVRPALHRSVADPAFK